jgi:hypothetical protein
MQFISKKNPTLSLSPSQVISAVSLSIFREFISALEGNAINITDINFIELDQLCEEFGFTEIGAKLSEFHPSMYFKESESKSKSETEAEDANSRGRIAALKAKAQHCEDEIAILQNKVTQFSTDFRCFINEVSTPRSAAAGIQTLSKEISSLKTQI